MKLQIRRMEKTCYGRGSQVIGARRTLRLIWLLLGVWLLANAVSGDIRTAHAQRSGALHTEGGHLVNAAGNRVILTGINWFGLETESFAPHGLWARNWEEILDQVRELGFNTIRLPYSNALFDAGSVPNSVNYELNPDLEGLSGLEIMDKIVEGAGERGIRIILDRHRPGASAQSELWYTAQYDEQRWIDDWVMLAQRYAGNDTVIGADLHNEPHGPATWGTGDEATDWRLAAERAGNAILAANPDWLIIVQGIEQYEGDWYWWGGNLMGAGEHPVRLEVPNRLVYSSHVYGPGVYPQPWFDAADFPDNLAQIWDEHWGFLAREEIAPVIVGEFGGRSVGEDKEGVWQRALFSYLREHSLSYFYWTLNPNSGDTGGLLLDDWESVDPDKQALLESYQFPPLGEEGVTVGEGLSEAPEATPMAASEAEPTMVMPTAPPVSEGALQVHFRMPHAGAGAQDVRPEFIIVNSGSEAVSLAHVEVYYWLDDGPAAQDEAGSGLVFHCDWAAVGCSNVAGDFESSEAGARYLRISFDPRAGSIAPGEDSGEIKVRFNRADWSALDEEAHYSFNAAADYEPWERITLAVDGQSVWGVAPGETGETQASATPEVGATQAAAEPSGTPSPTPEEMRVVIATLTPQPTAVAEADAAPTATTVPTVPPPAIGVSGFPASIGLLMIVALVVAAVALIAVGVMVGLWLSQRNKD